MAHISLNNVAGVNLELRGYAPIALGEAQFKSWKVQKTRDGWHKSMAQFVRLNRKALEFLGITAEIVPEKQMLLLKRSRYSGVVPLRHPTTGLGMGILTAPGSYGEDVTSLLAAMHGTVTPEFDMSLKLDMESPLVPPVFMECLRYLDLYEEAQRVGWRKFSVEHRRMDVPRGRTLWGKYVQESAKDPRQSLVFENRINTLTDNHLQWRQLRGVLRYALDMLGSPAAGAVFAMQVGSRAQRLRYTLTPHSITTPAAPPVTSGDPPPIKRLKESAAMIMNMHTAQRCAWRVDMAEFFEQYVQHLLQAAVGRHGGRLLRNHRIPLHGAHANWMLRYLEPDAIVRLGNKCIVVDAKYKSHMYNTRAQKTIELQEAYRHDLHQVLAYTTFGSGDTRQAWLVYPAPDFTCITQYAESASMGGTRANITMVGVPLRAADLRDTVDNLATLLKGK